MFGLNHVLNKFSFFGRYEDCTKIEQKLIWRRQNECDIRLNPQTDIMEYGW